MTRPAIQDMFYEEAGFVPGAIAPMGKWEPNMEPDHCLREVTARAAAALAISRVLHHEVWFLSAEGHLRGQPRPGCELAAQVLMDLGADPRRVRCWPAANRTLDEVQSLSRMRDELDAGGLLLVTSSYHVLRTRVILQRALAHAAPIHVVSLTHPVVHRALDGLPPRYRERLIHNIERGRRRGIQHLEVAVSEGLAFAAGIVPGIERLAANTFRGAVDRGAVEMYQPRNLK